MTFDRPVAAATWPAAQFAIASFIGAGWDYPTLLSAQNAEQLSDVLPMSGAAPMLETGGHNSKVWVTLKTPEVGLYVVALCLLHDPAANEFQTAGGNLNVSAATVDGNKVVAIVRTLAPSGPSPIMGHLVFSRGAPGRWRVAGVSVKRLTY
ncbi:MAG: hypothetical protein N2512_14875 [Armatimonadetes bacterium]|nr:hypothetical protein [Armatimonadota bacterium]